MTGKQLSEIHSSGGEESAIYNVSLEINISVFQNIPGVML